MSDYIKNGGYTGHAWQGNKYETHGRLGVVAIAKLLRAEIKQAIKNNELPQGKYSVTCDKFAGGSSIDIVIKELEFPVLNPDYDETPRTDRYTRIARLTLDKLNSMLNAYRFNDSDGMIDYFHTNFYGHVKVDWNLESTASAVLNRK